MQYVKFLNMSQKHIVVQIIYLIQMMNNCYGTIDINLSELQYLADHLHKEECKKLVAALHFKSYDKPNMLDVAENKVPNDLTCLQLLIHWNSYPGEGKGETHELLLHRLRQIKRDDLADWLGKTVFHQLGIDLEKEINEALDDFQNITERKVSESAYETDTQTQVFSTSNTTPLSIHSTSSVEEIQPQLPQTSRQLRIDQYTLTKKAQEKIDKALAYFVAVEMMPYNIVEKVGFKLFVNSLNPGYKLPGRKSLTEVKIPSLYKETEEKIRNYLQNVNFISFTTDCWTTGANRPFIAFTAHYINDNFELMSFCIGCQELIEDHTAENISDIILIKLCDWNIAEKNKHVAFTTDYGSNMVKAIKNLEETHICCFGHAINTAVSQGLSVGMLEAIKEKAKHISSIFNQSWMAKRDFSNLQDQFHIPKKNIPTFSKTRWWSLLNLFEVIVEQQLPLMSLLQSFKKGKYKKYILNEEEIDVLKTVITLLKPIQKISDTLSGENYVTSSTIIPICQELQKIFNEFDSETEIEETVLLIKYELSEKVLNVLKDRYEISENTLVTLQLCTFLDPRFKHYITKENIPILKHKLLAEFENVSIECPTKKTTKKQKSELSAIFKMASTPEPNEDTTKIKFETEIEYYLKIPSLDFDEDPLMWWKSNSLLYPHLSTSAKKYLSMQATSVPSERIFSKGGQIVTDLRSSLSSDNVSELIFLACNKKFV